MANRSEADRALYVALAGAVFAILFGLGLMAYAWFS